MRRLGYTAVALECENPGVTARALANIADMLGAMSQGKGGLRSGPALNQQWQPAFRLLEVENLRCPILDFTPHNPSSTVHVMI